MAFGGKITTFIVLFALYCGHACAAWAADDQTPLQDAFIRAQLFAKYETVLSSGMVGKIVTMPFREGDVFSKDSVLVEFDCGVERAEYSYAAAQRTKAAANVKVNKQLDKLESISVLEVETGKAELAMANARVELMKAKLKPCKEFAPFDGRVADLQVTPLQRVNPGDVLMTILDPTVLEVELRVPSTWLVWLQLEQVFELTIEETGEMYAPQISMIGTSVDPVSQTVKIVGELQRHSDSILPGMSGNARFTKPVIQ